MANSPPTVKPPSRAALLSVFATIYVVWGSTYLAIRVAVETFPPFIMAGTRYLLAGGLLYAWLRWRGGARPTRAQWRDHAITGVFLLLGGNGLVCWAEQTVPSGVAALIIGVTPLFMVVAEWAGPGGTRPSGVKLSALLLGLGGVAWLAAPWETTAQGGLPRAGVAALVAACAFWAIGSIHSRHTRSGADLMLGAALQMLVGGVVLLAAGTAIGEFDGFQWAVVSAHSWAAFFYLVFAGALVGYSAFVWLMRHSTPALVSTYAWVNPVVAVWLGWLLLSEPISGRTLAASGVIVVAVAVITLLKTDATAKPPAE